MNTCWPSTDRDRRPRPARPAPASRPRRRPSGSPCQAVLAQHRDDLGRDVLGDPGVRVEGAAQGGDAGPRPGAGRAVRCGGAVGVVQPRVVELVVAGRRAEVPHDRLAAAGEQREPDQLVHRPGADVGRGHVADVGEVEAEQRAKLGPLQLRVQPGQPLGRGACPGRPGSPSRQRSGRRSGRSSSSLPAVPCHHRGPTSAVRYRGAHGPRRVPSVVPSMNIDCQESLNSKGHV